MSFNPLYYRTARPITPNRASPQARGLVAWWSTIGSNGQLTLKDFFNRQWPAPFAGGTDTPAWDTDGEMGPVVRFDGVDDNITIPSSNNITGNGSFTASVWFKVDIKKNYHCIFGRGTDLWGNFALKDWGIMASATVIVGSISNGTAGADITIAATYNANQWYHVVITWDGTTFAGYLDGRFVTSATPAITVGTTHNIVWGDSSVAARRFDGVISDTLLYNYDLAAVQVAGLYNPSTRRDLYKPPAHRYALPAPAGGSLMNQLQGPNLGADLFNGALL